MDKQKVKMNDSVKLLKIKMDLTVSKQQKKIGEHEVIELLGNEFPGINSNLENTSNRWDIYVITQCFADFTKQLIRKGNLKEVKHCFKVAEKMLNKGSNKVRNAIENVYVFSVSSAIDLAGPTSEKVKSILTDSLKKEYLKQIYAGGI